MSRDWRIRQFFIHIDFDEGKIIRLGKNREIECQISARPLTVRHFNMHVLEVRTLAETDAETFLCAMRAMMRAALVYGLGGLYIEHEPYFKPPTPFEWGSYARVLRKIKNDEDLLFVTPAVNWLSEECDNPIEGPLPHSLSTLGHLYYEQLVHFQSGVARAMTSPELYTDSHFHSIVLSLGNDDDYYRCLIRREDGGEAIECRLECLPQDPPIPMDITFNLNQCFLNFFEHIYFHAAPNIPLFIRMDSSNVHRLAGFGFHVRAAKTETDVVRVLSFDTAVFYPEE